MSLFSHWYSRPRHATSRRKGPSARSWHRPLLEQLEARELPATGLGLIPGLTDSPSGQLVARLYYDLLHRVPQASEAAGWIADLNAGVSAEQVALSFTTSTEYRANLIQNDYNTLLNRSPSPQEVTAWMQQLQSGLVEDLLAAKFLASDEFYQDHGSNIRDWLAGLYSAVLDRAPDAAGLASWSQALQNGTSREAVALGVVDSEEAHQLTVGAVYQHLLSRNADAAGLAYWVAAMNQGLTTSQLEAKIAGSAEYVAQTTRTTYYVSKTGSDSNPGTLAQPFASINHAVTLLHPGDTLYIRGGIYAETLQDVIPSGTDWSAPVTLASYPGETAILQGSGESVGILISSHSYIVLQNLVVDGKNLSGGNGNIKITYEDSSVFAHHIRVIGCEIKNYPASSCGGVLVTSGSGHAGVDYNEVINCYIHDIGGSLSTANGIYFESDNNLADGNTITRAGGCGIQIYSSNASAGTTVSCSRNIIRNNVISNSLSREGIFVSYGDSNQVYNNACFNNADAGIYVNNNSSNGLYYSNTLYGNKAGAGAGTGGLQIDSGCVNNVVMNNISYNPNGGADFTDSGTATVSDYNLSFDGTALGAHSLRNTNPLFVNAATGDFHLQAGSPAIDAGTPLVLVTTDIAGVPRDTPYEIGAYEYN